MSGVAPPISVREQLEDALAVLTADASDDVAARAEMLYARWYAATQHAPEVPAGCPPNLVELLRAAHVGFREWEEGWTVGSVGRRGQAVVRRAGAVRLVDRSDYAGSTRAGLLPRPGDEVCVTSRHDVVDPDDGWWRTSGGSWSWRAAPPGLIRFYFNRDIVALPPLVSRLTALLATEREPWLLKCATDPSLYARADAIVAYVTPATVRRRSAEITQLAQDAGGARVGRPPLTLPVVGGLAAAFDPGRDESFGSHRCRLIAEATGPTVEAVLERFARDGVDPARPWARLDDPPLPWER